MGARACGFSPACLFGGGNLQGGGLSAPPLWALAGLWSCFDSLHCGHGLSLASRARGCVALNRMSSWSPRPEGTLSQKPEPPCGALSLPMAPLAGPLCDPAALDSEPVASWAGAGAWVYAEAGPV